jgi:hypothetical protein
MAIPMGIPAEFLQAVKDGLVIRYGCILKEVGTGRIVGHLKELTGLARVLSSVPLGPALAGASGVAQIWQRLDTHHQLGQVRQQLGHLRLVSSVGAVASVAGLGVSVAGFAVVLRRLERLEQRLNQGMERLRAEVERLHLRLDLLQMAELETAWQQLDGASRTDRSERAAELLKGADRTFHKYRNYYHALIAGLRPARRTQLTLPQVRELHGRYFACAAAELEANFLLHDFAQWHYRHEVIVGQLDEVCGPGAKELLQERADALGLVGASELQDLAEQAEVTHDVCREGRDRILTAREEVRWLEGQGLAPAEYLRALRAVPEDGIAFLRHGGEARADADR